MSTAGSITRHYLISRFENARYQNVEKCCESSGFTPSWVSVCPELHSGVSARRPERSLEPRGGESSQRRGKGYRLVHRTGTRKLPCITWLRAMIKNHVVRQLKCSCA